jgi:hypothetical protein
MPRQCLGPRPRGEALHKNQQDWHVPSRRGATEIGVLMIRFFGSHEDYDKVNAETVQ